MSPNPMRSFDPRRVGALECTTWVTYYRRDWPRFLGAAIALVRHGFGLPWHETLRAAWLVLRANQLWAPAHNDPDGSRRCMRHSDSWVAAGCPDGSPLVAAERAALVRSYATLLAAVHR